MPATEILTVNGIKIPKIQEAALYNAYREDLKEMDNIALFASSANVTINLYKPSALTVELRLATDTGKEQTLGFGARGLLSSPTKSYGNGLPVVNLFYNHRQKRYELLKEVEVNGKKQFNKVGTVPGEEDSLYHCFVRGTLADFSINKSTVQLDRIPSRMQWIKQNIDVLKTEDEAQIRTNLKNARMVGQYTKNILDNIASRFTRSIHDIRELIGHLTKEYQHLQHTYPQNSSDVSDIGDYIAKHKNPLQSKNPCLLNEDASGYIKLENWREEELDALATKLQYYRLRVIQATGQTPEQWQEDPVYRKKFIEEDNDYKAFALITLLDKKNIDDNERFRQAISLLNSTDPEMLKRRYMQMRNSDDPDTLENDLKAKFHVGDEPTSPLWLLNDIGGKYLSVGEGHKLQFPFLKSILEEGRESPTARLALQLGLLYRGTKVSTVNDTEKENIKKLVHNNIGEMAILASDPDKLDNTINNSDDEFLKACYKKLKQHPTFLGQLQSELQSEVTNKPLTDINIDTISQVNFSRQPNAGYLFRLMYQPEHKRLTTIDNDVLKEKLVTWIKTCPSAEREKFIKAGNKGAPNNPYNVIWRLMHNHFDGITRGNWGSYLRDIAKSIDEEAELKPILEVRALLKYQQSKNPLQRYKDKKATLAKVLNLLSATNEQDPLEALSKFIKKYPEPRIRYKDSLMVHFQNEFLPPASTGLDPLVTPFQSIPKIEIEYESDPIAWLHYELKAAGIDAEGREQTGLLLQYGGSYYGDEATDSKRNIDNYLKLKRKIHRSRFSLAAISVSNVSPRSLSIQDILTLVGKVKPGSYEHQLLQKDVDLLLAIRKTIRDVYNVDTDKGKRIWNSIRASLDLRTAWQDLNKHPDLELFDESPDAYDKDKVKAFGKKYKEEDVKKKLWAAKYALTYHLGIDESLVWMSNQKELLKIALEGQMEGYKGANLEQDLNHIDPSIRHNLLNPPAVATKHEKTAYTLLRKFIIEKQDINFTEFLDVAKGLYSKDYAVIDFAVNDLSPEHAAKLWCDKSYQQLKNWCNERLLKTVKLNGIYVESQDPSLSASKKQALIDQANQLKTELAVLDKDIDKHQFTIDDNLKAQLQVLTVEGKTVEFERQLKQKIGETMLSEPEKFKDLNIPAFDLSRKATALLAEANIDYQRYLNTGVGYHRINTSGLVAHADVSRMMGDIWKMTHTPITGTPEQQRQQEQVLRNNLKESVEKTLDSLENWQGDQDEYTRKIVDIISQTMGAALTVALAATGIGGVGALIPLFAGKAAILSIAENAVKRALLRRNDVPVREIIKKALSDSLSSIPTIASLSELKSLQPIASALAKSQITAISKAVIGGVADIIAAKGSGNFDLSSQAFKENIAKKLGDYKLTEKKIYETVLTSASAGLNKVVTNAIKVEVTQMDEAAFEKLSKDEQDRLKPVFKPYQTLYKQAYKLTMQNKAYNLFEKASAVPADLVNLAFPDSVKPDKNKIEEQEEELLIANALVQELADKGLKVDDDFDYSDVDVLIEQIIEKLPTDDLNEDEKQSYKNHLLTMKQEFKNKSKAIIKEAKAQADKDTATLEKEVNSTLDNNEIIEQINSSKTEENDYGKLPAGNFERDAAVSTINKLLLGKKLKKNIKNRKKQQEFHRLHKKKEQEQQQEKRKNITAV